MSGEDYFTALPNEILTHIALYLSEHDRLKLRAVFPKSCEKFVLGLFGDKFKRLYVFSTHESLNRFNIIAQTEFFQRNIKEVVFVLRTLLSRRIEPVSQWRFASWYYTERDGSEDEWMHWDNDREGDVPAGSYESTSS